MRIAVSGATGFIGRHVVTALDGRSDVEVIALVRRPTDALPTDVVQVSVDIADAGADVFERVGRPDVLIHLAWGGLPNYRSLHHFEEELPAQYRFLKHMVVGGLGSLVVTGTCYEYGMVDGELREDMRASPANPYAHAKVVLHRQLQFLKAERPFALTWARLFYMWGADQTATSLYPLLQAAIDRGDDRFAMSGGEQLRDYLPVAEVARLLVDMALHERDADAVNISSGKPVSVRTLVEHWIAERGSPIVPDRGRYPYADHEPMAFWGSTAKRTALVGSPDLD